MLIQARRIALVGLLLNLIPAAPFAWPTYLVIRGGALKSPAVIWHSPIPVTHLRETALSLLYEASFSSEVPCKVSANGVKYEVAAYWFGNNNVGRVGTKPPADLAYSPAYRAAVIDSQGDQYCWVGVGPGTDVIKAGTAGVVIPAYAAGVLRDVGIR